MDCPTTIQVLLALAYLMSLTFRCQGKPSLSGCPIQKYVHDLSLHYYAKPGDYNCTCKDDTGGAVKITNTDKKVVSSGTGSTSVAIKFVVKESVNNKGFFWFCNGANGQSIRFSVTFAYGPFDVSGEGDAADANSHYKTLCPAEDGTVPEAILKVTCHYNADVVPIEGTKMLVMGLTKTPVEKKVLACDGSCVFNIKVERDHFRTPFCQGYNKAFGREIAGSSEIKLLNFFVPPLVAPRMYVNQEEVDQDSIYEHDLEEAIEVKCEILGGYPSPLKLHVTCGKLYVQEKNTALVTLRIERSDAFTSATCTCTATLRGVPKSCYDNVSSFTLRVLGFHARSHSNEIMAKRLNIVFALLSAFVVSVFKAQ